ncbi:hypothetical protein AAFN88_11610 [Pelagibius sp. CAU 1746]|uniref:hypothetical protein n=1 Tax=Pelagibius sp. CAU 1746 TaxID=3140370 RepID=UPI00325A8384
MAIDPIAVWANMKLKTWPERYWMLALSDDNASAAAAAMRNAEGRYASLIRDQGCLSVILDEAALAELEKEAPVRERFGPFKIVSTDGELPFDVIGFLRPLLEVLNGAGIKAGPQCGADFDHLFIYEKDIRRAEELMDGFVAAAKQKKAAS